MLSTIYHLQVQKHMHPLLAKLTQDIKLIGDTSQDVCVFLARHGHIATLEHSQHVATEAVKLARRFVAPPALAEQATWLHDISAVFPSSERLQAAQALQVAILPEEAACPMILHQKLSAAMAHDIFQVSEPAVLSAIGCHTTLRADATLLDKVVFLADKLQWDQPGKPPYLDDLLAQPSLDKACFRYLDYLWQQRDNLPIIHPWMAAAHRQLSSS